MYKIIFEDNKAVSAQPVEDSYSVGIKIDQGKGQSQLRWMVIFAGDEAEGIKIGNKIAGGILVQNKPGKDIH